MLQVFVTPSSFMMVLFVNVLPGGADVDLHCFDLLVYSFLNLSLINDWGEPSTPFQLKFSGP